MKKTAVFLFSALMLVLGLSINTNAQENGSWSVGADLYNRYVWRGTDFGNSPVVQPTVEYSIGGFAIGAWGSYSTSANVGGTEADLYASYGFDFGFDVVVTDYFFPVEPTAEDGKGGYFNYDDNHLIELGLSQSIGDFYLSGNVLMNGDNDLYFEAGYSFGAFDAFVGAGNNAYTLDCDFNVCNVGISTSKEIKITDNFSLPMSGSVILNPDSEQIFFVVGVSL